MYVGLDESVAVTDADGDHRVHCDTVGGQMAEERGGKNVNIHYQSKVWTR